MIFLSTDLYVLYLNCIIFNIWFENAVRRLQNEADRRSGGTGRGSN